MRNNVHSTPDNIKIINLMRMEWAEHGACTGNKRTACKILVRKLEKRDH
jgi:ribonuclease I